jgi:hypothetical protein
MGQLHGELQADEVSAADDVMHGKLLVDNVVELPMGGLVLVRFIRTGTVQQSIGAGQLLFNESHLSALRC